MLKSIGKKRAAASQPGKNGWLYLSVIKTTTKNKQTHIEREGERGQAFRARERVSSGLSVAQLLHCQGLK